MALQLDALQVPFLVVDRLQEYVDAERLLCDPDAPEPPYWAHLWPGSRCLARLMARTGCAGRRVIDIGCGLGLAGIVAGVRGAAVTLIDTARAGLQIARANAALNQLRAGGCGSPGCRGSVAVVQTDIACPGLRGRFDYALAADVTYDPMLQRALASFLSAHLAPAGRAWCAESVRTFDQGFRHACEAHGLQVDESAVREHDEGREVDVRLTEISWPS